MNHEPTSHSRFPFGTASKAIKRKALWLGALWLIGGATLMFYISSFLSKKHFAGFNQAYVNAPIEGIKLVDHGLAVQLHIKGKNYIFYPTTNTGESIASKFIEEAHVGDSITKGSKSDTLYLLRSPNLPKVIFKHF